MSRLFLALAVFVALSGLYLLFAGSVDGVELAAMVVCASAGTALAIGLEVVAKRHYALIAPPGAVLHPFVMLLPETITVGRGLLAIALSGARNANSTYYNQPFKAGSDDTRSSTRRALTVVGVSLAPKTFVISGERGEALLLHGLPVKEPSPDRVWPT